MNSAYGGNKVRLKILVTGAAGMVGWAIKKVFRDHKLMLTDLTPDDDSCFHLNVTDIEQVKKAEEWNPNLIIHLAAMTNLEECERYPELAYRANHTGTMNMGLMADKLNIPIVYISTAGIYDGEKIGPYLEYDTPDPINHYGKSKLYGEYALYPYSRHYIFRAGWMFGGGPRIDKKFVKLIYKIMSDGIKEIYAIDDVFGSPTYSLDLAEMIRKVVVDHHGMYGVYHCGGKNIATRFSVAQKIIDTLAKDGDFKLNPVQNGFFKSKFPCNRS